ncbi:hypothetical protein Poly41_04440 [Novipirellula artificiosorum]|uniref:Prenyltransferase and squalene oxidase repeat protein n=2 Tax=Novipirellula artificiosorum TaxID=2528016 RepID=A0A5C6DZT2_9BACT|nr:hypothetical protein Poly41_04440 [Novipirellula artificiosorum]
MWPLDAWLAGLSLLVVYLIVTRLRFDDPRWLYNGWTYAVAVPLVALSLSLAFRGLASRFVQKSIQVGFLFSVLIHLLLLILAVNVVVFSRFFPEAFTGVKPERSPVRKTVPEYLFQTPTETAAAPDWSQPVDAETASRVIPDELRQLPPLEHSATALEMPRPVQPDDRPMQKFLRKRPLPELAEPKPADSPAKLARRELSSEKQAAPKATLPKVPELTVPDPVQAMAVPRNTAATARSPSASRSTLPQPADAISQNEPRQSTSSSSAATVRRRSDLMPTVGDLGLTRQSRARLQLRSIEPAGASPAPQTVAIASIDEAANQMLSPVDVSIRRQGTTQGAQLADATFPDGIGVPSTEQNSVNRGELQRRDLSALSGVPDIVAAPSLQPRPSAVATRDRDEFTPAGVPTLSREIASQAAGQETPSLETGALDRMNDRAERSERGERNRQQRRASASSIASLIAPEIALGPSLDVMSPESIAGLANRPEAFAGVIPTSDLPDLGALEMTHRRRERRDIGGPVTPAGSKIAAVESFSRRIMRTQGGAAPTPAGLVGPATEEAIELGLAYLAETQNEDGSWSLSGHGEEVFKQSDAAATGLALLAFQGAGYTHRQHQYADTVSRALQFLITNQRTNGDLCLSRDAAKNQDVAFYSHGIAALALCEAYGMTQDEELQAAAQMSLDYIGKTQNVRLGGWRYVAQVESDTSVSGWMMMALKSGELSGLEVPPKSYASIDRWLDLAQQNAVRQDRYRYNPFAANTPAQRHGREPTPTMTAVGILMRMYSGWRRDNPSMQSAADYLLENPPQMDDGSGRVVATRLSKRDAYYWYYATQVMFHMGGKYWERWNRYLNPLLLESQIKQGPRAGSWDPRLPVEDRWSLYGGRLYVTTMNLLNLEVYYRHLPIYDEVAE